MSSMTYKVIKNHYFYQLYQIILLQIKKTQYCCSVLKKGSYLNIYQFIPIITIIYLHTKVIPLIIHIALLIMVIHSNTRKWIKVLFHFMCTHGMHMKMYLYHMTILILLHYIVFKSIIPQMQCILLKECIEWITDQPLALIMFDTPLSIHASILLVISIRSKHIRKDIFEVMKKDIRCIIDMYYWYCVVQYWGIVDDRD